MKELPKYEEWAEGIEDDLNFIKEELHEAISDSPESIKASALTAEGWYGRMVELLAEANQQLDLEEAAHLQPKAPGFTDYDREIFLAAEVAHVRAMRDKIEGFCESIKQRISLAQSLLGYEKAISIYGDKG